MPGEGMHDIESQPAAGLAPCGLGTEPAIAAEGTLPVLLCEARAVVTHLEFRHEGSLLLCHLHRAAHWREFGGIGNEVLHDLPQSRRICRHEQRLGLVREHKPLSFDLQKRPQAPARLPDEGFRIQLLHVQGMGPRPQRGWPAVHR